MGRMVRRARLPRWGAGIIAAISFPLVLVLAVCGCFVFVEWLFGLLPELDPDRASYYVAGLVYFFIPLTVPILLAYLVARFVYCAVRWKLVEYDGSWCTTCGYDLTGNVSGVCPECGEAV